MQAMAYKALYNLQIPRATPIQSSLLPRFSGRVLLEVPSPSKVKGMVIRSKVFSAPLELASKRIFNQAPPWRSASEV